VEQGQPAMAPDMERPATAWTQTGLLRLNQVAACYGLQWERPATALVLLDRERPAMASDDAKSGNGLLRPWENWKLRERTWGVAATYLFACPEAFFFLGKLQTR